MVDKRITLVTGGNRGLGFEVCRQLAQTGDKVILTSRDAQKGEQKADELRQDDLDVEFAHVDVADPKSIEALHQHIEKTYGRLDVLINNAAILLDKERWPDHSYAPHDRLENLQKTLQTNVVGLYEMCDYFAPLMRTHHYGRIVNVSSGLGQITEMQDGYESYRISKVAVNAITRIFAARYRGKNVLINSVCPGWVKTDMGGAEAPRDIQQGAQSIVWAANLPDGGPTGGFFRDGKPLQW